MNNKCTRTTVAADARNPNVSELPEDWESCWSSSKQHTYYFNKRTGQASWFLPPPSKKRQRAEEANGKVSAEPVIESTSNKKTCIGISQSDISEPPEEKKKKKKKRKKYSDASIVNAWKQPANDNNDTFSLEPKWKRVDEARWKTDTPVSTSTGCEPSRGKQVLHKFFSSLVWKQKKQKVECNEMRISAVTTEIQNVNTTSTVNVATSCNPNVTTASAPNVTTASALNVNTRQILNVITTSASNVATTSAPNVNTRQIPNSTTTSAANATTKSTESINVSSAEKAAVAVTCSVARRKQDVDTTHRIKPLMEGASFQMSTMSQGHAKAAKVNALRRKRFTSWLPTDPDSSKRFATPSSSSSSGRGHQAIEAGVNKKAITKPSDDLSLTATPSRDGSSIKTIPGQQNEVNANSSVEEMDVDPDTKIMNDILGFREIMKHKDMETGTLVQRFLSTSNAKTKEVADNKTHQVLAAPPHNLYIIIDTNVLLKWLLFLDDFKDQSFAGVGRPSLVIPWVVMQELDGLKNNRRNSVSSGTQLSARNAVNMLHGWLERKHPRIIGQTPTENSSHLPQLLVSCNDDLILQCCLQFQAKYEDSLVVLFTLDKNLHNKALVMGLTVKTKQGLLDYLRDVAMNKESEENCSARKMSTNRAADRAPTPTPPRDVKAENRLADEIICDAKSCLRDCLSTVLETEMKEVYQDLWVDIVYRKPPWTLYQVVESINKHWRAVFGMLLKRCEQPLVTDLMLCLKVNPGANELLQEAECLVKCGLKLCVALKRHNNYSGVLETTIKFLEQLNTRCKQPLEVDSCPPSVSIAETKQPQTCSMMTVVDDPTMMKDSVHQTVKDAFQTVCLAIIYFRDCIKSYLSVQAADCEPSRPQTMEFFAKFCATLMGIHQQYLSMLQLSVQDAADQPEKFCTLCQALDRFAEQLNVQPWTALSGQVLQLYFLDVDGRQVLQRGYEQLVGLLNEVGECEALLSASELAAIQQYCQQAVGIT